MLVPEKEINISISILGLGYLKKAGVDPNLIERKLENPARKEATPMRISSSCTITHLLRSAESKLIKPYTSIGVRTKARKSKRHSMTIPLIDRSKLSAMSYYVDEEQDINYVQVAKFSPASKVIHKDQDIARLKILKEDEKVHHVGYMTKSGIEGAPRASGDPPKELPFEEE